MPVKRDIKVEWFADEYTCDQCHVSEKCEYKALENRLPEELAMFGHEWRVIERLASRRDVLPEPLVFCSRNCMAAYMDAAVLRAYQMASETA